MSPVVLAIGVVLVLALGLLLRLAARRRAELGDRDAQLRSIAAHLPGVIYTHESRPGQPRKLLYMGPGMETIIGPESAAAVQRDFDLYWELVHPMDRGSIYREARTGRAMGLTVDIEYRVRTDEGTYRWVRTLAHPTPLEDDGTRWHVVLVDITEQKQAEHDLRNTRARLEHLVGASPAIIYSRHPDADQAITYVSPNVTTLVGWPATSFIGDPRFLAQLVHPDDRTAVLKSTVVLLDKGDASIEYRLRHCNGHYVWVHDQARVVRNVAEKVVEIVGSWADVTERHIAAERQKLMMNELDHRVKNNLASVQAIADLTLAASESLESFRSSFSGRIRAMARTHEALARHHWEGVELGDIIRLTVEPYTGGRADRITMQGDAALLPSHIASPLSLASHELVTNAAKYGALSSASGRVDITWTCDGNELRLDWTERGGPPAVEPDDPGFGLQLLHGLVERELGGEALVEFRPEGFGCRLTLPLERAMAKAA